MAKLHRFLPTAPATRFIQIPLMAAHLAQEGGLLFATSLLLLLLFSMNDHPFHSWFKSLSLNGGHKPWKTDGLNSACREGDHHALYPQGL